jgi:Tfp pilus assembly protein PilF
MAPYPPAFRAEKIYNHALGLLGEGEIKAGIGEISDAINLDSHQSIYFLARASAYKKIGDFSAAQSDIEQALRLQSNYTEAYVLRANIEMEKGDLDRAISDFQKVLTIDHAYVPAIQGLEAAKVAKANK